MRTRSVLFAVLLLASISLVAQSRNNPPSVPSRNNVPGGFDSPTSEDVQVYIQVTDPASHPLGDMQVLVELASFQGGVQQAVTDGTGRVSFVVKAASTYQVKVSGPQIEPTETSFQLFPSETSHQERIAVKLKKTTAPAPGGNVATTALGIPAKASQEFVKGTQEMSQSNWESAKAHFSAAIQEYPKYDSAYNNLGVVEMQLKNTDAAAQAFSKAAELNDKNVDALTNLAQIRFQQKQYDTVKELLSKALTVQPNNPKTLTLLAYSQFQTKDFDAALATAQKVHQGDADKYPFAHFIAARVLEIKGDQQGAKAEYETFLKEAPDSPQAPLAKEALVRLEAKK